MARKIPVGDAMELDPEVIEPTRAQQARLTQANSMQPRPLGAQGPQFNRTMVPPATPPAQPGPGPARAVVAESGMSRIARPALGGAAVGFGVGSMARTLDKRAAAAVEPFTPPPTGPGEIPRGPNGGPSPEVAPAPIPMTSPLGVGPNNDFTRNVANVMNAVPGVGAAANALRAGSRAAQVANAGAAVTGFVRGAQAGQEYSDATDRLRPAPAQPTPVAAAVAPQQRAEFSDARNGTYNAPAVPGSTDGVVYKNGNSYSGKNIAGNVAQINDRGTLRDARGSGLRDGVVGVTDYDRQLAAEGQARAAAERANAQAGPTSMSSQYGRDLAIKNAETSADSIRFDAKMAGRGTRGSEALLRTADKVQEAPAERFALEDKLASANRNADVNAASDRYRADAGIKEAGLRNQGALQAANQKFMLDQAVKAQERGLVRQAFAASGGDPDKAAGALARLGYLDQSKDVQGYSSTSRSQAASDQSLVDSRNAATRKLAEDTAGLFKGEFTSVDKDGKQTFDQVGAQRAADVLGRIAPNFSELSTAEQNRAKAQASLLVRIQDKAANGGVTGLAAINPFATQPPRDENLPAIKGAGLRRMDVVSGALTPGIGAGEWELALPDGRSVNAGALTKQEIETLIGLGAQMR